MFSDVGVRSPSRFRNVMNVTLRNVVTQCHTRAREWDGCGAEEDVRSGAFSRSGRQPSQLRNLSGQLQALYAARLQGYGTCRPYRIVVSGPTFRLARVSGVNFCDLIFNHPPESGGLLYIRYTRSI